jgi:CRP-like cAMP-binding protein
MVELLIQLRKGGIFAGSNIDALIAVARHTPEIRVEPGERFWAVGEPSSFWLRIDYGRVRCTSADGKIVNVAHNFILGIMDSLGGERRSYEARAETRVVAYRTELESFLAVLETHFELARALIAVVSRTLLETPDASPKA